MLHTFHLFQPNTHHIGITCIVDQGLLLRFLRSTTNKLFYPREKLLQERRVVDGRRMVERQGRVAARQRRDPGAGRRRAGARVGREALALLVPRVLGAPHVERLAAAHHIAVLAQALDGTLDLHRTRRRRGEWQQESCTTELLVYGARARASCFGGFCASQACVLRRFAPTQVPSLSARS